jgi:ketosteroid isomerase-like protein
VSEQTTRAIVEEIYDAYARRDFEQVATFIHDDIDWVIYGPMEVFPFAGARRGRTAVLEALGGIAKDYALDRYEPKVIIVEGDRAAVMSEVAFRQRKSDRILRFQLANFLRLQDGRVIEFREFANTFDLVEQALGHFIEV